MTISTTAGLRPQDHVAYASQQAPIASPDQATAIAASTTAQTNNSNVLTRSAFACAGAILTCVSVALAASAGWQRGASTLESVIWASAGVALALCGLFGLSAAVTSSKGKRTPALVAWVLGLSFTVVAALGSQHGGRELASRTDNAASGERQRLEQAYRTASDTLAALPPARPSGTIEQELATTLKDKRLADCRGWLESKRLRTICVEQVEPRRTELTTAQAREKAQGAMTEATTALSRLTVSKPANSDAEALARYLGALGISAERERGTAEAENFHQRLADLISLLTVIAIEVCGSVAIALGRQQLVVPPRAAASPGVNGTAGAAIGPGGPGQAEAQPDTRSPQGGPAVVSDAARRTAAVVEKLKAGALAGRQTDIARALGLPKTTLRRIVESDTRLKLTVGAAGSRLELT